MPETEEFALHLPHQGAARLVERVLARDADRVRALARIPRESAFRTDRSAGARVPALLALEMAAQVAATFEHDGSRTQESSPGAPGLLVGLREVMFHVSELSADADFLVEVEMKGEVGGLREYSFSIHSEGERLAEGKILTYLPGT